jgi:hypothetical protein
MWLWELNCNARSKIWKFAREQTFCHNLAHTAELSPHLRDDGRLQDSEADPCIFISNMHVELSEGEIPCVHFSPAKERVPRLNLVLIKDQVPFAVMLFKCMFRKHSVRAAAATVVLEQTSRIQHPPGEAVAILQRQRNLHIEASTQLLL